MPISQAGLVLGGDTRLENKSIDDDHARELDTKYAFVLFRLLGFYPVHRLGVSLVWESI